MAKKLELSFLNALLFVNGENGVDIDDLKKHYSCSKKALMDFLNQYQNQLEADNSSGLNLLFYNNRIKLITKPSVYEDLQKFFKDSITTKVKLSQPALEVLAIIAYNKKVTKKLIEQYRGVSSESSLNLLLSVGLIESHRTTTSPFFNCYKVTDKFFDLFKIKNLNELKEIIVPTDSNNDLYIN
ncbi:SMC-Scp complex subunit ScpB [Mycoplasma sp. SG1]|uniref:SMC-Scp complex subunit ScpB n=1 Tax=Mycoplasma sp. SG1 TaxID=2810348 RepID=UPI00202589C2|nr:SMC-Scp complex subunit ScpB [Mycoplasma sp. SG1]URM52964.1 SMC-Scp complex subunit ScpB [Mycoplasma sp. SG1]